VWTLPITTIDMLNVLSKNGQEVVMVITPNKMFYLLDKNKTLDDYEDSDAKENLECYMDYLGDTTYRRIP
jgi:hypothetical protein